MSRPDKAVEPSMEEILASIRKIISEEPIGTRPDPTDGQAPTDALGRYEPGAEPAFAGPSLATAPRRRQVSDPVGIDEMLGLAQGTVPRHAAGSAGEEAGRFVKPAAAEPRLSPSAGSGAGVGSGVDATRDGVPVHQPMKRDLNGHGRTVEPVAAAMGQSSDAAATGTRSGPDVALSEARAKIDRHLGKPAHTGAADRPLVPGLKSIRDADFRGARQDAASKPAADGLMARVSAASVQPDPSATYAPAAPVQAHTSGGANGTVDPAPEAKGAVQKAPDSPVVPKADSPKAPLPDAAMNDAASAQNHAASAQGDGKPLQNAPAAAGMTASPPLERARAFEDAVAEMLRPMLREWLDANLPRLVQEALREEMAKSSLPGKDQPGG